MKTAPAPSWSFCRGRRRRRPQEGEHAAAALRTYTASMSHQRGSRRCRTAGGTTGGTPASRLPTSTLHSINLTLPQLALHEPNGSGGLGRLEGSRRPELLQEEDQEETLRFTPIRFELLLGIS